MTVKRTRIRARALCVASIVLVSPLVSSCATYVTSDSASNRAALVGLSYYLPMRRVKITFERRLASDALDKLAKANAAEAAAKKSDDEAKADAERLNKEFAKLKSDGVPAQSDGFAALSSKRAAAEVLAETSKAKLEEAKKATKAADDVYKAQLASTSDCRILDVVSVQLDAYVADSRQRYAVRLNHSPLRSETLALKTTKSGLLSTATGEATDQSQEVLLGLARSLGGLRASQSVHRNFSPPSITGALPETLPKPKPKTCKDVVKPMKIEGVVDPTVGTELATLAAIINGQAYTGEITDYIGKHAISFEIDLLGAPISVPAAACEGVAAPESKQNSRTAKRDANDTQANSAGAAASPRSSANLGIVYRRELPVVLRAFDTVPTGATSSQTQPIAQFMLEIPNHSPCDVLPMEVWAFGKAKSSYAFENGMLTGSDEARESEAMKVASLPFEALKATTQALGEIVKLRLDIRKDDLTKTEQERDLIKLQTEIAQELEKLRAAREAAENQSADSNDNGGED